MWMYNISWSVLCWPVLFLNIQVVSDTFVKFSLSQKFAFSCYSTLHSGRNPNHKPLTGTIDPAFVKLGSWECELQNCLLCQKLL